MGLDKHKDPVMKKFFERMGDFHEEGKSEHFSPTMKLRFVKRAALLPGETNVSKIVKVLQQQFRGSLGSRVWKDIPLEEE